jgi:hypothetical protein
MAEGSWFGTIERKRELQSGKIQALKIVLSSCRGVGSLSGVWARDMAALNAPRG